ncbi:hypothetical protein MCHI_003915 [Candidatus Magnetoovum chiemensis]|nr:hypothetical protein MCHI_003915 [Candidatus Magnetoovum chiemensis]
MRASCPSLESAIGNEPATSARPPSFAKGAASDAIINIFNLFELAILTPLFF